MGYKIQPLGQLCDVLDSRRKPITKKDRISGEYPYYGATGVLDHVEGYIFDETLVLVGEDGAKWGAGENTAFSVDGKCWVNNHAHVLRPRRNIILDKWLIYYLNLTDLSAFITGLTVPKLNQEKLRQIPIPVPTLPEQKRIVAILDEAFEGIDRAIANTKKNLANAREVFERRLRHVFGCSDQWKKVSIGEIAQIKGGKRVPKGESLLNEPTPFPYLRVTDFGDNGTIDLTNLRYVSAEVQRQIKAYVIRSEDLYISIAGTIGRTGIVPRELDGAQLTENACRLVFKPGISNRFIYYFTKTRAFREQAAVNTRTAAQPKLALSRLATVMLRLPEFAEQERWADEFDALSEYVAQVEAIYRQKLTSLGNLKQAILQKAFAGELAAQPEKDLCEAAQ